MEVSQTSRFFENADLADARFARLRDVCWKDVFMFAVAFFHEEKRSRKESKIYWEIVTVYRQFIGFFLKLRNFVLNLLRATPNALLLKRHQAQTASRSNFFQPHAWIVLLEVHFDAMAFFNFITGTTRQFHLVTHLVFLCSETSWFKNHLYLLAFTEADNLNFQ